MYLSVQGNVQWETDENTFSLNILNYSDETFSLLKWFQTWRQFIDGVLWVVTPLVDANNPKEDGGSMFLLNVGVYLQVQMLSQSRRPATT
jgi:hypothetical protein